MRMVSLGELDRSQVDHLETLTFAAAGEHDPTWLPAPSDAREEIADALAPAIASRVLLSDDEPIAWVATSHQWGHVWELHPLIVAIAHQRRGHGRRLVEAVEHHAAMHGGLTMWVGTSDTTAATSLGGVDLYADPLGALATIQARQPHAFRFWQRVGYRIVGVVPDAEGFGKPSLCLAKRLVPNPFGSGRLSPP
jgi:aminoglycoside 6'-N-acetyltransferase I